MQRITKNIDELTPYENNPRRNDDAVEYVANSIREFGFKVPVIIDRDGVIVAGHTRIKACKRLGIREVPCVIADDLTDDQIKAFRLADNKVGERAEWDFDMLDIELEDIELDMEEFGFVLENLEDATKEVEEDDIPDVAEEATAKLGDIYQLGDHRLICGDATDPNIIDILMDGAKAEILFTSPPYADIREYNGDKDLTVEVIAEFIPACLPHAEYMCVNLGLKRDKGEIIPYWNTYLDVAKECGLKLVAWNIWDKGECGSVGQQSAMIPIRHEWIFVFGNDVKDITPTWERKVSRNQHATRTVRNADGSTRQTSRGDVSHKLKRMESVLLCTPEKGKIREKHPATFPVRLPAEYIKAMTQEGDAVLEPFGGSGTTMIACEQLGRQCYMVELDPCYVDVIIARWENLTGEKAVRISERR